MEILQTFETTIISRADRHLALSSIFVPVVVANAVDLSDRIELAATLGSEEWTDAIHDQIPNFIALGIEREAFVLAVGKGEEQSLQSLVNQRASDRRSIEFANEVFYQRLIPLTQSPLALGSLSELIKAASVGAVVGFIAVAGHPIVLIAVPAGIILCGAATGIANALEEGLRERILTLLRDHPRQNDELPKV